HPTSSNASTGPPLSRQGGREGPGVRFRGGGRRRSTASDPPLPPRQREDLRDHPRRTPEDRSLGNRRIVKPDPRRKASRSRSRAACWGSAWISPSSSTISRISQQQKSAKKGSIGNWRRNFRPRSRRSRRVLHWTF